MGGGRTPTVSVMGSVNFDRSYQVGALPKAGETIHSRSTQTGLGGKGANQAIAASLLGASVRFLAAVGDDSAGDHCKETLRSAGVDLSALVHADHAPTGEAFITVDDSGNNHIVITAGANEHIPTDRVDDFIQHAEPGTPLLLQGEVSLVTNQRAIEMAEQRGLRTILNIAPFDAELAELASKCWCVVLNETEAAGLLGNTDAGAFFSPGEWVDALTAINPRWVVTLGSDGAWAHEPGVGLTKIDPVQPTALRDSTGAGDAFVGALGAGLARGLTIAQACAAGASAGSAVCAGIGASSSYFETLSVDRVS